MLQQIPADPFGDDERPSRTPPPDWRPGDATASRRQAVVHRSSSRTSNSSNKMKNSTNKKRHSVSQSINMLCDKIENAPTAMDEGGMSMMFMLQQQHSLQMQLMRQEQKHDAEKMSARIN